MVNKLFYYFKTTVLHYQHINICNLIIILCCVTAVLYYLKIGATKLIRRDISGSTWVVELEILNVRSDTQNIFLMAKKNKSISPNECVI